MNVSEEEIQIFNDSLDRLCCEPGFLDDFYRRFPGASAAVAASFANTDMRRQKRALKASLYTAMLAADGNRPAIAHLELLRDRHRHLGIVDEHYDLWLDCLVASARECGWELDVRVERAWRKVLAVAVAIKRGRRI